jgi:hypothetical protein
VEALDLTQTDFGVGGIGIVKTPRKIFTGDDEQDDRSTACRYEFYGRDGTPIAGPIAKV